MKEELTLAKKKYKKGTVFLCPKTGEEIVCSGSLTGYASDTFECIYDKVKKIYIWTSKEDEWSQIISQP